VGPLRHHGQRDRAGLFPVQNDQGRARQVWRLAKDAPLGRIGGDEDLKGATLLFASDAGKHITGQTLAVDGGVPAV
jgi:NAD(P)-dependent dehydrogenase (short-subunit alcohol dehydrogenase family)